MKVYSLLLTDNLIEYMKGDVLAAFRNSAKGELTIFNLANAPAELSFLKKYGDLILFAKDRQ